MGCMILRTITIYQNTFRFICHYKDPQRYHEIHYDQSEYMGIYWNPWGFMKISVGFIAWRVIRIYEDAFGFICET